MVAMGRVSPDVILTSVIRSCLLLGPKINITRDTK